MTKNKVAPFYLGHGVDSMKVPYFVCWQWHALPPLHMWNLFVAHKCCDLAVYFILFL